MMADDPEMRSLAIFAFVLVSLLILAMMWCLLSTCLGPPLMNLLSGWWDVATETARLNRRQRPYANYDYEPVEQWELGTRRNRLG